MVVHTAYPENCTYFWCRCRWEREYNGSPSQSQGAPVPFFPPGATLICCWPRLTWLAYPIATAGDGRASRHEYRGDIDVALSLSRVEPHLRYGKLATSYTDQTEHGLRQPTEAEAQRALAQARGNNHGGLAQRDEPGDQGLEQLLCTGVAKETFSALDRFMYYRAQRYMKRRHPRKSGWWRTQKYWGRSLGRQDRWVFQE